MMNFTEGVKYSSFIIHHSSLLNMDALYVLWIILLVVTVLVLPFIVSLLNNVLRAARNTERYFREMLDAGVGIANNTEHIKALNSTIEVASGILSVAGDINEHSAALGGALKSRAEKNQ